MHAVLIIVMYSYCFAPHCPQNAAPGAKSAPQLLHFGTAACSDEGAGGASVGLGCG